MTGVLAAGAAVNGVHDWLFLLAALLFFACAIVAVVAVPDRVTKFLFALIAIGLMLGALARLFS